eukprot:m.143118 g.143118  ORF g.143118 m.143118 type:complete len:682 (-) comp20426_c0_seq1:60-2105(-)
MATKTVFIANADSYLGRNLGQHLAKAVIGSKQEAAEEAEEGEEAPTGPTYTVVGTRLNSSEPKPAWLAQDIEANNKDAVQAALLSADYVVYDLFSSEAAADDATWAVGVLEAEAGNFGSAKTFLALSQLLTWGRTQPSDPDDPDLPLSEEEYKRRRPHSSYKVHTNAEKVIIKAGKKEDGKLKTYVINSGVLYGAGENVFHGLFKTAWQLQQPEVPVYGGGENALPTIHVLDLCDVVLCVLETGPATRYIVATDEGQYSLGDIARAVSEALDSGKVRAVRKEDALLDTTCSQLQLDTLLLNLKFDAATVKELAVEWRCSGGLVEALPALVDEYKQARNLQAVKIVIAGPPASGKSTTARDIARHYKLPHLHLRGVIAERIARLTASAALLDQPRPEDATEEQEQALEQAQADKDELEAMQASCDNGRYPDSDVLAWFQERLRTRACRNQGYVLDGYPKTEAMAKLLFAEPENADNPDPALLPEFVFALDASDEFLRDRVMNMPEAEVQGTHNTEDGFNRRIAQYRAQNTDDNTVLNFYDFLEIHPDHIDVTKADPVLHITKAVGPARNYGLAPAEQQEVDRIHAAKQAAVDQAEAEEKAAQMSAVALQHAQQQEEWDHKLDEVRRQEKEMLEEQSLPLRNFLMKHVMPTLSKGLMEVCQARPADPVDFLAEFLFKNNPQID